MDLGLAAEKKLTVLRAKVQILWKFGGLAEEEIFMLAVPKPLVAADISFAMVQEQKIHCWATL